MLSENQQKNYDFFEKHLHEYLNDPLKKNKYGIFCDEELKGVYDSFATAFTVACGHFPMGEFIIQQIMDENEIVEFLSMAVI